MRATAGDAPSAAQPRPRRPRDQRARSWELGGPRHPSLHALVLLFAHDEQALDALEAREKKRLEDHGGRVVHADRGRVEGKEPFGFADGIEQPHIDGSSRKKPEHADAIAPGEFVLGYSNAYGEVPTVPAGDDGFDLGKNGTYLVYRKLRQDVAAFWSAMFELAEREVGGTARRDEAVAIASRIVGRWPSGAPLVRYPERDPSERDARLDVPFRDDKDGLRCPLGAHIRRVNPRHTLQPDPTASLKAVARHRLLRRGRVYGPASPATVDARRTPDDADRGLLFIAVNASIRRQFEFIQQTWINNPKFAGLHHERDPLVASARDEEASFTIQGRAGSPASAKAPAVRPDARRCLLLHARSAGPRLARAARRLTASTLAHRRGLCRAIGSERGSCLGPLRTCRMHEVGAHKRQRRDGGGSPGTGGLRRASRR